MSEATAWLIGVAPLSADEVEQTGPTALRCGSPSWRTCSPSVSTARRPARPAAERAGHIHGRGVEPEPGSCSVARRADPVRLNTGHQAECSGSSCGFAGLAKQVFDEAGFAGPGGE